ncbi:MAG: cupin domain-containing protein [Halobacteriaceae archaeon]
MPYHVVDPADIDPMTDRSADARSISEAAGLETLGLRVYEAAPGEQIPLVYHYHDEQEEAFYVLEGDLHVETPEGEYVVAPGEVFVAHPESPHRAHNPASSDGTVRVVAVGAPSVDDAHAYEE